LNGLVFEPVAAPYDGDGLGMVQESVQYGRGAGHVTEEFAGHGAKTIWRVGHRRWAIENKAFRELAQEYHLEHCFHHHPAAMLAQMLILMLAFNMFNAYAILQNHLWREGKTTLCDLTEKMLLHLELDFLGVPVPLDSG
jgi:hypothetical protein